MNMAKGSVPFYYTHTQKIKMGRALVASGSSDQEVLSQPRAKSLRDPILKKLITIKGWRSD
jgi:hypothetical protein